MAKKRLSTTFRHTVQAKKVLMDHAVLI